MKEQNGVHIYDRAEVPQNLNEVHLENLLFPFGIKEIIQSDGSRYWIPGTKEDLLAAESKRLGRDVREIEGTCAMTMPPNCSGGGCAVPGFCALFASGSYYYCGCHL